VDNRLLKGIDCAKEYICGLLFFCLLCGFQGAAFTGFFNGDKFTVNNLAIDSTVSDSSYIGLFGCILGG